MQKFILLIFTFFVLSAITISSIYLKPDSPLVEQGGADQTNPDYKVDPSFGGLTRIHINYPDWLEIHSAKDEVLKFTTEFQTEVLKMAQEGREKNPNLYNPISIYADFENIAILEYEGVSVHAYTDPNIKTAYFTSTHRNGKNLDFQTYVAGININKSVLLQNINAKLIDSNSPIITSLNGVKYWNIVPATSSYPQIHIFFLKEDGELIHFYE